MDEYLEWAKETLKNHAIYMEKEADKKAKVGGFRGQIIQYAPGMAERGIAEAIQAVLAELEKK